MVFLPEAFDYIGQKKETIEYASTLKGDIFEKYKKLAKENKIWISYGGFHERKHEEEEEEEEQKEERKNEEIKHTIKEKEKNEKGTYYNTHVIVNDEGGIEAKYRKIHLFDINIPNKVTLKESDTTIGGNKVVVAKNTPIGDIGMGICYDVRFPELYRKQQPVDIITAPSAFTKTTGEMHWHVLLRARAIENQAYMIAAAQTGKHSEKRESYGHSLVVDPTGKIIVDIEPEKSPAIAYCYIDKELIQKTRTTMPVYEHRRI
mmetsp:Transcript_12618/g.18920  ORF Transcript_12618/g.18920 Transcript_12618/m.18920 type:complete len:261 (-) Transcript_12618:1120-1902(-)